MEWYCQYGAWYSQLWFWRFNDFFKTLERPKYEWRFPICMTFYYFECAIVLSHIYLLSRYELFIRSSITFMYTSPLHCIYYAPSHILTFWLMFSVLCTTINKVYLIVSYLSYRSWSHWTKKQRQDNPLPQFQHGFIIKCSCEDLSIECCCLNHQKSILADFVWDVSLVSIDCFWTRQFMYCPAAANVH